MLSALDSFCPLENQILKPVSITVFFLCENICSLGLGCGDEVFAGAPPWALDEQSLSVELLEHGNKESQHQEHVHACWRRPCVRMWDAETWQRPHVGRGPGARGWACAVLSPPSLRGCPDALPDDLFQRPGTGSDLQSEPQHPERDDGRCGEGSR